MSTNVMKLFPKLIKKKKKKCINIDEEKFLNKEDKKETGDIFSGIKKN